MGRRSLTKAHALPRPTLAIVVTYFGPAPLWLPAFLRSCRTNADVRFLVYTDFEASFPVPENVEIKHLDLEQLNARASQAVRTDIRIERAGLRKVNDLKPLCGLMFADDLRPFDWWAYSDLDIVWGDIRRFLTDDVFAEHDIISTRRHKLSGHMTLIRNTDATNHAVEIIPDVAAALANPQYLRLDERVLTHHLRERIAKREPDAPRVYWEDDLTMNSAYQRALPDDGDLWWRDGRTYDAHSRELMYLHFHKLKQHMEVIDFGFDAAPAAFSINRRGVFSRSALPAYTA